MVHAGSSAGPAVSASAVVSGYVVSVGVSVSFFSVRLGSGPVGVRVSTTVGVVAVFPACDCSASSSVAGSAGHGSVSAPAPVGVFDAVRM